MSSHRGLISKYHLIFMCYSSSILLTENSHFDAKLKPSPCLQLIITALVTISAWTPVYPAAAFHSSEYLWCFQSQRVRKTGSFHILRLSNKSTGFHELPLYTHMRHSLQHILSYFKLLPKVPIQFRTPKNDLFTLTETQLIVNRESAQMFQIWAFRVLSNYRKRHSVFEVHRKQEYEVAHEIT